MNTRPDEDVRFVIQRELSLLDLGASDSIAQVEALLHPDFSEVAATGRRLGRREVIAAMAGRKLQQTMANGSGALAGTPAPAQTLVTASAPSAIRLSGTVILVSYLSEAGGEHTRHSALWLKAGPSWRRYFHQVTPVAAS